jgi:hypothetical protein
MQQLQGERRPFGLELQHTIAKRVVHMVLSAAQTVLLDGSFGCSDATTATAPLTMPQA